MKDGFIRVAAATPDLKVADPVFNREQTWKMMQEAASRDVKILVFPELGLTGYTCSDLFLQDTLIDQAMEELLYVPFEFENSGTRVIHYTPETYEKR